MTTAEPLPAWQQTGTSITETTHAADALRQAGLAWTVEQRSLHTRWGPDLFEAEVPSRVANVRSDNGAVLGVVSPAYQPFQNQQAFAFLDDLVADGRIQYERAGALHGGRLVWLLARLPREIRVAVDDILYPYILLVNGHNGNRALRVVPTTTRLVCGNTLHLTLRRAAAGLLITHDQTLPRRLALAQRQLEQVTARVDRFGEEVALLAHKQLDDSAVLAYFVGLALTRTERQKQSFLDALLENWHHPTNNLAGIAGTAWAAYNAVSLYADHQLPIRGVTEAAQAEHRLYSAWFGAGDVLKQLAYDRVLQLALAV
jgi:phage/plasmid-like protein (TIGR03299 family)